MGKGFSSMAYTFHAPKDQGPATPV